MTKKGPSSNTRSRKTTPDTEKRSSQDNPDDSTKRMKEKPPELNAATRLSEQPAPQGRSQSITAERRSIHEASPPPDQTRVPRVIERESPEAEPVQGQSEHRLNDDAEVNAPDERSNPVMGESKMGSDGAPNPSFIQKPPSFIQPDAERSGNITAKLALFKLQSTVRKLREYGVSYSLIETITEVPKSTAHLWSSDVQPIPKQGNGEAPGPNQDTSRSDDAPSQPMNSDGDFQQRQVPRISSEVLGPRPKVVEGTNGFSDYEQSTSVSMDGGQTISSQPVDVDILRLLFQREERWIDVFLSIKAASVAAGQKDAVQFFYDRIMKDSEDAEFFRSSIPHDDQDPQSLRENFAMIVRKSNAFDEANKKSGLATHKGIGA